MSEAEVEVVEEEAPPEDEQPAEVVADEAAAPAEHAPGEFVVPEGASTLQGEPRGERRTVAVAIARFNAEITNALLETALDALDEAGVARDAVTVVPVPGAFELPLTAMALAKTRRYSCIVALGCVIRGQTPHFDFVAGEAASGLQLAAIETGVPVSFGVLTTETMEQARARRARGRRRPHRARDGRPLRAAPRRGGRRRGRVGLGVRYTARPMSKVCAICGKKPGFGNNRSHSMVATKRRFNPNLQRVRVLLAGKAPACLRLHPLPQGGQGDQGRLSG